MRLALVNPNTSAETTAAMMSIARAASHGTSIDGFTAPFGAPLITSESALIEAGEAVLALAPQLRAGGFDGVIVSAFGDPGLELLRERLDCPVTGIAEAGMMDAAAGGRSFAVVTTTPGLVGSIAAVAARYGHDGAFLGTELTAGDPALLMTDPDRLAEAMALACKRAIEIRGAEALVIGGGPLAMVARTLAGRFAAPIIEPVPAAARLAILRGQPLTTSGDEAR